MKIIVAAGALKGSLSAVRATESVIKGLRRSGLTGEYVPMPIADGGDGTLDAFLNGRGQRITVAVHDPLGRPHQAEFGLLDNRTAVIEMALASGIGLLDVREIGSHSALTASTYGTGELIGAALDHGAERLIIGLGGSATTDGATGLLSSLGACFLDGAGNPVSPGGGSLHHIETIDLSGLDPRLRQVEVLAAADVTVTAIGDNSAAHMFAPQKGASPHDVERLEAGMAHFFELAARVTGIDVRHVRGGGAAGACAAGLVAFLNARLQPGIDLLLDEVGFDEHLRTADLVITSEGQIDTQTLYGKAPLGVARRAAAFGVPTVALVGGVVGDEAVLYDAGILTVPIPPVPMLLRESVADAENLVERAALRLGYLLRLGERLYR